MGITILQTGTIRIRPSHRNQSAGLPVLLRRANVLLDRSWTDPLPINTYLIDHPDGPVLVDTGESPHATDPGWLPPNPFFHLAVDIDVPLSQGIGALLAQRGLAPGDLQAVAATHLHHDHGDGLADLAGARILVTAEHWEFYRKPIRATIEGAVPQHWPKGFAPELLQATGPAFGPFPATYPITADGTIFGIPTPGHVPGHMCVVWLDQDRVWLFGGDVTYDQALLDQELTDGVNSRPRQAVEQLRRIKQLAAEREVIVLPAHDPDAARRLEAAEAYHPSPLRS